MFLGGQWVFWGASGFSDSLAPRASGCHSPMSRPDRVMYYRRNPGVMYCVVFIIVLVNVMGNVDCWD